MLTNCLSRSRYVNQSSSDSEQSNVDAHTTQPIAARLLSNASCATIFVWNSRCCSIWKMNHNSQANALHHFFMSEKFNAFVGKAKHNAVHNFCLLRLCRVEEFRNEQVGRLPVTGLTYRRLFNLLFVTNLFPQCLCDWNWGSHINITLHFTDNGSGYYGTIERMLFKFLACLVTCE